MFSPSSSATDICSVFQLLAVLDWAMLCFELQTSAGPMPPSRLGVALKLAYWAVFVWSLAMASIKTGVALTLLRIRRTKGWNAFLYSIIVVQVLFAIQNVTFVLLQCRPVEANWTFVPGAKCFPVSAVRVASTTSASVNIVTDILLSAAPIRFLVTLRKSKAEKALLIILMSLGLVASAASIVKTLFVREWGKPTKDSWALTVSIGAWTILEQLLAALAASAVCFKGVLRRSLARFGINIDSQPTLYLARIPSEHDGAEPIMYHPRSPISDHSVEKNSSDIITMGIIPCRVPEEPPEIYILKP